MNAAFSAQAFQPAFSFAPRAVQQSHRAGTVSRSRSGTSLGSQAHRRAAPGGEYGPDGTFYPGGKFIPGGAGPAAAGPQAQQPMFGQQPGSPAPQQPMGGGDEAGLPGGPQDDPGGGGMPGQQPGGMPQQAATPPKLVKDRVIDYHNLGEEPPHQVQAGMAWLRQPTGPLPHPDDEHGWVQLGAGPELLPGLLFHALAARGGQNGKWFGKGLAQALGDDADIPSLMSQVPVQKALFYATLHPEIQDHFRRYSEDPMGKSLAEQRVLYRATRTLADKPGFGQDYAHAMVEGLTQAMAPPPNPDLV